MSSPAYAGRVVRYWGFALFVVVVAVHIVVLATDIVAWQVPTKALLMPALLVALLVSTPRIRSELTLWAGLGVAFAWAGDVLLASPGEVGFLVGLVCFLVAHVSYLVLYLRPARTRRVPWWTLLYGVWWVVLIVVLLPHGGALTVPLVLYGAVLCGAAAVAWGTVPLVGVGATLFLVSDTLLALRMFVPGFSFWQQDAIIMTLYSLGQGLIVFGAVRAARAARAFETPPSRATMGS